MNIEKYFYNRISLVLFIPLLLGMLTVFSFSPFNFTLINFIILPCFFLLLCHINKKSKNVFRKKPYLKNLFLTGYSFGVGFFFTGTYWISNSLTFDENFKFLIPVAIICIPLFIGLFFGLACLIVGPFLKNNFHSMLIFCASLSFLDFVRSKLFTGFPWNLWAYSATPHIEMLQIVNFTGLFGFNLLLITVFCSPVLFFLKKKKVNLFLATSIIILIFANYVYGSLIINKNEESYKIAKENISKSINIKIISPSFDIKYNLSKNEILESLNKLIKYSEPNKGLKTVFIWPEGVFAGYYYQDIKIFKDLFEQNFSEKHTIILGMNTLNEDKKNYYNSLIAVNNKFEIIYKYNKKKLVPFGEFLPAEHLMTKLGLKKITEGVGSFSSGEAQKNLILDNFSFLPLICYEIIFPELIQKKTNNTNFIVNLSEDAWFGNSIGPYQHFSKAIFRSIESNTFVLRSANKGFSAFINNKGEILKIMYPSETGNIEMEIPLINHRPSNKNDLIFFILLITYMVIFLALHKKNYD